MDNELILFDRLEVIRNTINKYGEDNFYISFSGGKDSTIVSHLIDEALPNNKIPRIFINTGIEYIDMVKYVKEISSKDDRIIVYNSGVNIKQMLEKYGYPFKSKEHSEKVSIYQHSGMKGKSVKRYVSGLNKDSTPAFNKCPKILEYQFTSENKLKISRECCHKLKKEPCHRYEKESGRRISITGLRIAEGGTRRQYKGCVVFDSNNNLKKFKPINPCTDEWCDWYVESRNIKLCKLYYPPFNFKRTGCKGCPFALELEQQLEAMERLLPAERKQCELLWKPVYDEYRRIGYRLKPFNQTQLDLKYEE